jgi:DNA-binding CsgD family transcriptional regulator
LTRPLSPREKQVLALIAQAKSDKEIAQSLAIGYETVRGYSKSIYRKLGVHKRAACVAWYLTPNHDGIAGTEKAD